MTVIADHRLRRLKFRAEHRGTREADMIIGGFAARHAATWTDTELAWFEALLEEQDVDVMGWAMQSLPVPERFDGVMMKALQRLDYVEIAV